MRNAMVTGLAGDILLFINPGIVKERRPPSSKLVDLLARHHALKRSGNSRLSTCQAYASDKTNTATTPGDPSVAATNQYCCALNSLG